MFQQLNFGDCFTTIRREVWVEGSAKALRAREAVLAG
jgi:hypothetical protein